MLSIKSKKKLILTNAVNRYVFILIKKIKYILTSLIYRDYITSIKYINTTVYCFLFFFIIQSI